MKFSILNFQFSIGRDKSPPDSQLSTLNSQRAFDPNAWLTGADLTDQTEGAKLVTPYAQSAWVYIAVHTLAQAISQIPFRIARATKAMAGYRETRAAGFRMARHHRRALEQNEVESGPVVDLFNRPHPSMDRALFWESVATWEALRGEFFILPLDNQDQPVTVGAAERMRRIGQALPGAQTSSSPITRMLTLAPELFWHIVVGYELQGWRYTGSPIVSPVPSQILDPEEVIHSRSPNPYLYWRGLSPITLALLPAQSDYAAEMFMKGLMMNNADTGVIVTTEQQLASEQREALMAALRERKRKAGTPDRPLLLWGGTKLEKPAISSADMQFLENRKTNRQEICAIFGVPESMLGFTDRGRSLGGGGEMEQDKLNFIESKVVPHCRRYEAAVEPIIKSFGEDLIGYFDVDDLPILQNARRGRVDAAGKVFAMGVPFNSINKAYDLGFEDIKGGDTGYLPFNLQPAETIGMESATAPSGAPPSDSGKPMMDQPGPADPNTPEKNALARAALAVPRLAIAHLPSAIPMPRPSANGESQARHVCSPHPAYEASIKSPIRLAKSKLSRFFFEQRGRVISRLPEVMKQFELHGHGVSGDSKSWQWRGITGITRGLDDLWDSAAEDSRLLAKLKPLLLSDLQFGGAQLYQEIGQDNFNVPPKDAIKFLDQRQNVISGINQTTWDRLRATLQEGLQAGDPMDDLVDRIKVIFQSASDQRAETIATTEVNVAVNSGRHLAMQQAKVERKGWQTSHLENTRATHIANEELSDEQNGIPIDDLWPNGCLYPGDPDGDPGETINCRCFGFAIIPEGEPATSSFAAAAVSERQRARHLLDYDTWLSRSTLNPQPSTK